MPDSAELISSNTNNNTVTNIKTNDVTLAKENKETNTEIVAEKSSDTEIVTESTSSECKDVQDEANPVRRFFRIRKQPN